MGGWTTASGDRDVLVHRSLLRSPGEFPCAGDAPAFCRRIVEQPARVRDLPPEQATVTVTEDGPVAADLGRWEPLSVGDVVALLAGCPAPWWIAGGWAIDLHLGRATRPHADIDVGELRDDLPTVRDRLPGWDLHAADPPGRLRRWEPAEALPGRVQDVWCRRTPEEPWSLQLMVDDTVDGEWVYRKDPRIRRPVAGLRGPASTPRCPVLAPEVQLLHKSARTRPKDEADFHAVLPALDERRRGWLLGALELTAPGHPWRAALQASRTAG